MTRVDSAEIPYKLWRDHIEFSIPRIKLPMDWEERVTPLRACLIRWWRRRVTASFGKYRRQLETSAINSMSKNHGVRWDKTTGTYQWIIRPTENGWKRESEYGSSQLWFITTGRVVAEAGKDCITRAAYATWWK